MNPYSVEQAGPLRRGLTVWYPVLGGIAAWMVHLVFVSSWVQFACNARNYRWAMDAVTAAMAAATLAAIAGAAHLVRVGRDAGEEGDSAAARLNFLGRVGLLVGAINLLLIVIEGAYALVLSPCLR